MTSWTTWILRYPNFLLRASTVKNVSGTSQSATHNAEASESDEDSNAEDDAASEQEDDQFITDDDISSCYLLFLKMRSFCLSLSRLVESDS